MKEIIIIMVIVGFLLTSISACSLGTVLSAGKIVGETIYGAGTTKKEPDNQTKKRNTYYDPANPSD